MKEKTNETTKKTRPAGPAGQTEEERQAHFDKAKAEWFKKHGNKLPKVH